jgi:hypothetical protein
MKDKSLSKNKKLKFSSTGVLPVPAQAEACGYILRRLGRRRYISCSVTALL